MRRTFLFLIAMSSVCMASEELNLDGSVVPEQQTTPQAPPPSPASSLELKELTQEIIDSIMEKLKKTQGASVQERSEDLENCAP